MSRTARAMRVVGHGVVAFIAAIVTLIAAGLVVVIGPAVRAEWSGQVRQETIAIGPVQRTYRVYRPSDPPPSPGLVIDLHAANTNGFAEQASSGMDRQADQHGWIVAYPDGVEDGWEAYGCCRHDGIDDVAFLAEVISHVEASDAVDPDRIYVMGLSRGGMMAYRLACELPARIAAIAAVGGNMADEHGDARGVGCRLANPVSVLAIHGSADTQVPLAGGGRFAPFTEVIGYWRELNNREPHGHPESTGPWTDRGWDCAANTAVRSIVIDGGHHAMPGAPLQSLPWSPARRPAASGARGR